MVNTAHYKAVPYIISSILLLLSVWAEYSPKHDEKVP